jgi:hypothetical protein
MRRPWNLREKAEGDEDDERTTPSSPIAESTYAKGSDTRREGEGSGDSPSRHELFCFS